MRKFSSYGPIDIEFNYYVPREQLIDQACQQLLGEDTNKGGHYITVWAPRQTGKSWVMLEAIYRLKANEAFEVAILSMQSTKNANDEESILDILVMRLKEWFRRDFPQITSFKQLSTLFSAPHFSKPLLLILDEFDAMDEEYISKFANEFRNIYLSRMNERDKKSHEKSCLLHGLALIGVRGVLGIENVKGSPFNVQRGLHIPNLTHAEVLELFTWYQQESGQKIEAEVVERVYYEFQGQPGLTCWFGELLTEEYNKHQPTITMRDFENVYALATNVLPNNNILNIISKAKQAPYQELLLDMFKTEEKIEFRYDDPMMNYLYMNGVISYETVDESTQYLKFPCPFVQKRLFNYFAYQFFGKSGRLYQPFEDLSDTITEDSLNVANLLRRFGQYLEKNRHWLLKNAPRRSDLRLYEAVYHFNLYRYLTDFMRRHDGQVLAEFPTGNGQIDLIIRYVGQVFGIEVKSYSDKTEYKKGLVQAARYAKKLGLTEITLALFVEAAPEVERRKYEVDYQQDGVTVKPVFVEVGSSE